MNDGPPWHCAGTCPSRCANGCLDAGHRPIHRYARDIRAREPEKDALTHGFKRLTGSGELRLFCEARGCVLGIGFGTLTTHLAVDKVGWSSLRTFDQSSQTAILRPGSLARRAREHSMTAIAGRERRNGSDRPLIYARSPGDPAIDGLAGLGAEWGLHDKDRTAVAGDFFCLA